MTALLTTIVVLLGLLVIITGAIDHRSIQLGFVNCSGGSSELAQDGRSIGPAKGRQLRRP